MTNQDDARESERLSANEAEAVADERDLENTFEAMHAAIMNALRIDEPLTDQERADIFSRLETAYRIAQAKVEAARALRRQANAVNPVFMLYLAQLERSGDVGWGTTSAFLAKIGVPVRPLRVPGSERWLYAIEAESRGVAREQLATEAEMAVRFTQDADFEMWFQNEPLPVAQEPTGPITLQGQEFPVTGGPNVTMPQAFPGTIVTGDLPSLHKWVESTYPESVATFRDALLRENATIEDLRKRKDDDAAKERMQGEAITPLDDPS